MRDAFRRLVIEHPDDYRIEQTKIFLDYIGTAFGDLPPPAPLPPRKSPLVRADPGFRRQ